MKEKWLPVVGWEDYYEVSDRGRVRSLPRRVPLRADLTMSVRGRLLSGSVTMFGYHAVTLCRDGVRSHQRTHRLVLEAFVGPCPDGMEGCHNDGDKLNNSLGNLRWDTRSANMYDRVAHGMNPQSQKTHCPAGHPYDEANTSRRRGRRGRSCRACARERERIRRAQRTSAA
jgi:hypothetical protein